MSFWEKVHEDLRAGRTPECKLTIAEDFVRPPKGKPGRPKSNPDAPFEGYVASDLWGAGKRPRCLNPGCDKYIRKTQYTCSKECKRIAIQFFRTALFYLGAARLKALPAPPQVQLPYVATSRPLPQGGEGLKRARAARHGLLPKLKGNAK